MAECLGTFLLRKTRVDRNYLLADHFIRTLVNLNGESTKLLILEFQIVPGTGDFTLNHSMLLWNSRIGVVASLITEVTNKSFISHPDLLLGRNRARGIRVLLQSVPQ